MYRYSLTIPRQYNSGEPVPRPILQEIETELDETAGGWTRVDGVGGWSGDASYYREPVSVYMIDTADSETGDALLALAERTASALSQEAIYVTRQKIEAFLVAPVQAAA